MLIDIKYQAYYICSESDRQLLASIFLYLLQSCDTAEIALHVVQSACMASADFSWSLRKRLDRSYPVCRGDPDDLRHRFLAVKPSVTADDESAADQLIAQSLQYRLDEVLRVMFLLKDLDGLTQTRSARFLAFVHPGVHRQTRHRRRRRGHVLQARCKREEMPKKGGKKKDAIG